MGSSRALNATLGPLFSALYPLPKIAIFPILLMIFGPTELPKIIAVFITTFFVMQIASVSGVWVIDRKLLEGRAPPTGPPASTASASWCCPGRCPSCSPG